MTAARDDAKMTARLLAELDALGIRYLVSGSAPTGQAEPRPLHPASLLSEVARAREPRLRDAVVALLLLHPELADSVERARAASDADTSEQLATLALAALYAQQKWYPLLTLAFGHPPCLSAQRFASYWAERGLPPPACEYGELGMRGLAAYERERTGSIANFEGDWENQVKHLAAQEWAARIADGKYSFVRFLPPETAGADGCESLPREPRWSMSMRPDVGQAEIERFLQELGRRVQHSGRIYIAGGAALVHGQVRGQGAHTADIDLRLSVSDENEVETAIRDLKTQLGVNVELASPADFIPLPSGWESRSQYVGRYGPLDVFYFDHYATALAKIDRATSRDVMDVELLKQQGLIQRDVLETAFQGILPQLGHGRFFNVDPALFAQKFAAVVALVWGQQP
jgi:hypothetical protein